LQEANLGVPGIGAPGLGDELHKAARDGGLRPGGLGGVAIDDDRLGGEAGDEGEHVANRLTSRVPPTITLDAAASAEAKRHLDAMLRALQDALRKPPRWEAARDDIERAFVAYDAYIAHVVSRHPMSCRETCTACCHDNPRGVSGVELQRLHQSILSRPGAGSTMMRFAQLATQRGDPATWRARGIPCPLLKDGRCSAYVARPVACRAFFAITPPEWCSPGDERHDERVNPHIEPPAVLVQALRVLSERLGLANADDLHSGMARLA